MVDINLIMGGSSVLKTPIHKNQAGQVAIEFILVISFALGVTFLFFTQAFNATDGYLVHYANFMAGRTYLTADRGSNNVQTNITYAAKLAEEVYEKYPLKSFNINTEFNVITYDAGSGLFTGTTAKFEKSLNFFPGIGGGDKAQMLSETFLGKEPTRITCMEQVCAAITGSRTTCTNSADEMDATLYDNGC